MTGSPDRDASFGVQSKTPLDQKALSSFLASDTDRLLSAFERDGFALLRGVLNADSVAQGRSKIDELHPIHWDFTGVADHFKNVFNRDPFWLAYLDRSGVIELAEEVLGSNCHVIGQTCWRCHPGFAGAGLHIDYVPVRLSPDVAKQAQIPAFLCTAHFYLSPQPIELCPTLVIPGSHRAGRGPHADESDWQGIAPIPVLCDAGDVLFFRSDLWHGGSDNTTTNQIRYLVQVHYGRREMAQHFAPYLAWRFRDDVLAAATPRQRRLLGDHEPAEYD